jgi:hypothetical protein
VGEPLNKFPASTAVVPTATAASPAHAKPTRLLRLNSARRAFHASNPATPKPNGTVGATKYKHVPKYPASSSRAKIDARNPAASEKNIVPINASTVCPTHPRVTPPSNIGNAKNGNTATNP